MKEKIFKRAIFSQIKKYLFTDDIIVLNGARQVGKTYILFYIRDYLLSKNKITHFIDIEDSRFVKILDQGVESFLHYLKEEGIDIQKFSKDQKLFVFLDEIQYLKNPSNFLKLIADHYKNIKLIISGSSSFAIKNKFKDSLVGRTVNFEIFPLSFEELLIFQEFPFSSELLKNKQLTEKKNDELREMFIEYVLYGGYPKIVLISDIELKEKYLQQIIDTYIKKDIRDLANIKEIDKFNKLIEILASQSGQLLDVTEISNTCKLSKQTVEKYLFILENTYLIKLVRPYYKNIRSELFKTPKIFFYDSGLMQMLWLKQLQKEILGNVFETSVFGELVKKYGRENVLYWRTADKKEIDFILRLKNKVLPIEVKLNFARFNKSPVDYFCERYKTNYFVTALNGNLDNEHFCYPWSI